MYIRRLWQWWPLGGYIDTAGTECQGLQSPTRSARFRNDRHRPVRNGACERRLRGGTIARRRKPRPMHRHARLSRHQRPCTQSDDANTSARPGCFARSERRARRYGRTPRRNSTDGIGHRNRVRPRHRGGVRQLHGTHVGAAQPDRAAIPFPNPPVRFCGLGRYAPGIGPPFADSPAERRWPSPTNPVENSESHTA